MTITPVSGSAFATTDPATGELLATYPAASDADVRGAIDAVDAAYAPWKGLPIVERARLLRAAADLFQERAEELAGVITLEIGKRIEEARWEAAITSDIFRYYAEEAEALLQDESFTPRSGGRAIIQRRPVGALLGIMPWNYPLYQAARFVAPNLLLGNTMLIKHASSCPGSAQAFVEVLHDAGIPAGACINLFAAVPQLEKIVADPRIHGVSLTGSERAGASVAEIAGRNLKKVVLELGGSDPLLVLDDHDLDGTVKAVFGSRMGNMGQACNSPKRIIVLGDAYATFVDQLVGLVDRQQLGDPKQPGSALAPLSSQSALDGVLGQVERAVAQGAVLRTGGARLAHPGAYMSPAVLTDVSPQMDLYREECFGPVFVVYRAESEEDAVALANSSPYGLGATVFSADAERALRVGEQLDCGMVFVNRTPSTEPDLPFGGVKLSGFGRELGSWGLGEFANLKLVRL